MISLKNITKYYKLGNEEIPVLKGINLDLKSGELSYLLGESGCGKSTLLNIIGGLDEATSGEYLFNGQNVNDFTEKEWSYFRRKKIGFVFQNFNLIPHLTAIENIEMSMILEGTSKSERKNRAKELLELVGLKDREKHLPSQLSGGQKQRIAIARSLANDPDIILADEPTGALDSLNSKQIMQILKKVAEQGKIVLVVTHSQEYTEYADKIIKINDGIIINIEKRSKEKSIKHSVIEEKLKKGKKINWGTTLKLAFRNIKNKKWRNTLTALGASIGILGIATIGALGNGIKEKVDSSIDETAANYSIAVDNKDGNELLSISDMKELTKIKNVEVVYPYNPFQISLKTEKGTQTTASADSLVPEKYYKKAFGKDYIKKGKYPSQISEVAVPERIAKELYGNADTAIGQKVSIIAQFMSMKDVYQTIEIEAKITGIIKNGSIPLVDSIGISYPLAQKIMNDNPQTKDKAFQYTVIPSSLDKVNTIIKQIKSKGYEAATEGDINNQLSSYVTMASIAVGLLSGISLFVSSIMIGIVLYVSVLERTKEIGTLKAIGAFRSDIRRIFVTEGLMIGVLGGLLGALGSIIIGKVANFIIKEGLDKPGLQLFQFDYYQLLIIVIFSGLLGIIASFIPAFKAAKLNPVEALKYE